MRVLRAEVMGMCFGVRDALKIIDAVASRTDWQSVLPIDAVAGPSDVTIHGELVHNEAVLTRLQERGFRMTSEANRGNMPVTSLVLITAHGVSEVERQRLEGAGKQLLDTTCPLVTRAHEAAKKLQDEGYHVLVIGRPGHVEVQGIIEDLHSFEVIQTPEQVRRYPHDRLGIMCQTTSTERNVQLIRAAVAAHNPHAEIRFIDTVCLPTKEHQKSVEKLLDQVDAMVVVGGRNSNNTRELAVRCRQRGIPTWHVQSATDLDPNWFVGFANVGLTAGTSTLDATIEEVHQALLRIGTSNSSAAVPVTLSR